MNKRFVYTIQADELEKKMIEAADAIRRNAERGRTIKLRIAQAVKERDKVIPLPDSFDDDDEDDEEHTF